MRYLARRYGSYFGHKIPEVLDAHNLPFDRQTIQTRKDPIHQNGDVVTINRINKLNAREFVRTVTEIRTRFPEKLIYLPAFGLPNDYPILFYLGIDILDDSPIKLLGGKGCISEFGMYEGENCTIRNEEEKRRALDLIDLSLQNDKFREVVESHSFSNFSKEALRILDMEYQPFMENYMDLRPKSIVAANIEGIYRPEIVNYRKRTENLRQTADNLLLIPCSAIKPYSRSKTHRILHSFIAPFLGAIQEVVVTSPLGLVPRELESFFPAMYYDIPVTGYWFEEEKRVLFDLSKTFFKNKRYSNVFFLLPEQESGILDLFENSEGVTGSMNFENSEKLAKIIGARKLSGNKKKKDSTEYSNVLKYIFDLDLEPDLISQRKEGNRRTIFFDGSPLLRKTVSGVRMMKGLGEVLLSRGMRIVETEGVFRGDNLFIPGIRRVSGDVRPGMEVALVKDGSVVGRGVSQISDLDLSVEKKGIGVNDVTYFDVE